MSTKLTVKSAAGDYPISVGFNIVDEALKTYFDNSSASACFLFVDENVWQHHQPKLKQIFDEIGLPYRSFIIPEGEKSKSIKQWQEAVNFLLKNGVRRNTPLVAIGGGITGDLSGFAASSALRGIPLIHVPTTVLAMVDSSIGGKTGINHETGKNLIGAFYQPEMVVADTQFLQTLPRKEWINGLSEILKYGAISNSDIFEMSELFFEEDLRQVDQQELIKLIELCMGVKVDIVQKDEFEGGVRAFLNFGHTFAHALEKAADFDQISHGEAVFLGMLAAIDLSNRLGFTIDDRPIRAFRPLYKFGVSSDSLNRDRLIEYMQSDKKMVNEHIRFILLKGWQHPVLRTVKDETQIADSWLAALKEL